VLVDGNSIVIFIHNSASGAIHSSTASYLKFSGSSIITLYHNIAGQNGGAMYCNDYSDLTLEGNVLVTFTNNTAEDGGAISIVQSNLTFRINSSTMFDNNSALREGGALCLSNGFNVRLCMILYSFTTMLSFMVEHLW